MSFWKSFYAMDEVPLVKKEKMVPRRGGLGCILTNLRPGGWLWMLGWMFGSWCVMCVLFYIIFVFLGYRNILKYTDLIWNPAEHLTDVVMATTMHLPTSGGASGGTKRRKVVVEESPEVRRSDPK
jgi:hypothetical protein